MILSERKLSTEQRNNLDDRQFGIPEIRAYPLNDKDHVIQAVRMFNHVDSKYEKELADNLIKAINKFKIDVTVGDDNRFHKYYIKESRIMNSRMNNVNTILEGLSVINESSGIPKEYLSKIPKAVKDNFVTYGGIDFNRAKFEEFVGNDIDGKMIFNFNKNELRVFVVDSTNPRPDTGKDCHEWTVSSKYGNAVPISKSKVKSILKSGKSYYILLDGGESANVNRDLIIKQADRALQKSKDAKVKTYKLKDDLYKYLQVMFKDVSRYCFIDILDTNVLVIAKGYRVSFEVGNTNPVIDIKQITGFGDRQELNRLKESLSELNAFCDAVSKVVSSDKFNNMLEDYIDSLELSTSVSKDSEYKNSKAQWVR